MKMRMVFTIFLEEQMRGIGGGGKELRRMGFVVCYGEVGVRCGRH